ncbi:ribbon-helix-helix domain-containing protein [Mesorhizobium sp.]|uniref:ribbon-helix-helix domain-containing protein n=1 Tax=Mesorhizobium sp. TaxID=1871066 RepID=UPI001214A2B3|nr:MAG: ribbon-helix-helix protein, CopG family [Mesorhizobium sp.]
MRSHTKKNSSSQAVRTSVSFPAKLYRELEQIAKQKKVSLAWVVRDAAEKYIANQTSQQEQD